MIYICDKYLIEAKKVPNILDSFYIQFKKEKQNHIHNEKFQKFKINFHQINKKNKINEYIFPVKIKYDTNETFNKIDAEKAKQRNLFEINSDFSKRKIISEDESNLLNRIKEKIGFNKDIQINKVIEAKNNFKKDKKNIVQIKGDDSNNTPSENDKSLKELEDDSGYNSSNKEKKKKEKVQLQQKLTY